MTNAMVVTNVLCFSLLKVRIGRTFHLDVPWRLIFCFRPLQEFMRCVKGDLSGKKQENVHLWVKMGQGEGVMIDMKIKKAPPNHANTTVKKVMIVLVVSWVGHCKMSTHRRYILALLRLQKLVIKYTQRTRTTLLPYVPPTGGRFTTDPAALQMRQNEAHATAHVLVGHDDVDLELFCKVIR